ncbi:6-phosphogluconate dehydrogenase C-terminal domain-like protein [Suillus discolor]|uniref:6-phosphogluconate dehydrogenase C-terminal domain-like protein n=1 Tax=Suillus discolor TaxID=1912936 RepID=A0A9P7F4E8_9AGAM|nr:6-phosphogluconate dehydrogenase C-terminal domain-like protein [Suillus discolor]KAG2105489.1 6-phosphogluconate dehydrogenase C-terminal domain-like protein [Suillus discolor]
MIDPDPAPTNAIVISAGAMGSAIAKRLVQSGCTVYTNLDNRSPAAHQRALDAGMINLPFETLLSKSNFILSIVPPGEAFAFAQKIRNTLGAHFNSALPLRAFVDCNAVNPETVKRIGGLFSGTSVGFIDAGIVGTPPREGWDPTFYACSEPGARDVLEEFAALSQYELEVSLLKSEGAAIASSLKLCESMMKKDSVGLFMTMMQSESCSPPQIPTPAAHRPSPATASALMKDLSISQPALMPRLIPTISEGIPKAYRSVANQNKEATQRHPHDNDICDAPISATM